MITDRLVSTIIPVFNRAVMLREAVESVLAQTHRPIQIVIVDDGSTDETASVAPELAATHPEEITVIRQANAGASAARNRGLASARGTFVQFLDSDDLLLPEKFSAQISALDAQPEAALAYGKTIEWLMTEPQPDTPCRRTGERFETLFPTALAERLWTTETPLYRRTALEAIGPWSSLRLLEDWEYECRLGATGARLAYASVYVSIHRHHYGDRLGQRGREDDRAFRDRLEAHSRVFEHALSAGVRPGHPAVSRFARTVFFLAREAAARGMPEQSRAMVALAGRAAPEDCLQHRLFGAMAQMLGWRLAGRLSRSATRFRHG